MKYIYLLLIILIVLFAGIFAYLNNQVVSVNFLGFIWHSKLTLLLLVTLIFGVALGYLASMWSGLKAKRELSRIKRQFNPATD